MELEDMQAAWSQMSQQLEQQKQLTNDIIMKMAQEKHTRKFTKFQTYEGIGALICFAFGLYIIFNFKKLDTWYLSVSGVLILAYFAIIPAVILRLIQQMKKINITSNDYKSTLLEFTKKKSRLLFVQQLGIALNFILVIAILPVISKISNGKDIFIEGGNIWYVYIPVMFIFLILASRWGYKCYKSITSSSEKLIKDLEL